MSAEFPRRDDHRPAFLRPKTPQKARSPSTPLPQEAPRKTPDAPAGRKPHADREGVGFCRLRQPGAFRPAPPQKKLRIARKGGFCRAPHRQGRAFPKKQRMRRNTHPCAARHAEKGEGRVLQRRARASRRGQTEETVFFTGNAGRSASHGRPGKRLPAFPAIFPQPCLSKNKRSAARSTCSVDGHGTAAGRTQRPRHGRYPLSLLERTAGEGSKGGNIPPCFSRSSNRAQRSRSPAFSFHRRRFSAASSRRSSSRRSSLFSSIRQRRQDACSSEMPSSAPPAAGSGTSDESRMGPSPVRSHSRRTPVLEQIFSTTSVLGRFSFRS